MNTKTNTETPEMSPSSAPRAVRSGDWFDSHVLQAGIFPAALIAYSLTAVHQQMEIRTDAQEYGWVVPVGFATILIPTAIFAFLAGQQRASQSNDRS